MSFGSAWTVDRSTETSTSAVTCNGSQVRDPASSVGFLMLASDLFTTCQRYTHAVRGQQRRRKKRACRLH